LVIVQNKKSGGSVFVRNVGIYLYCTVKTRKTIIQRLATKICSDSTKRQSKSSGENLVIAIHPDTKPNTIRFT